MRLDFSPFFPTIQHLERNARVGRLAEPAARKSVCVCGFHLPTNTFHTVRQCQVRSVDCVALAIIITSPQLFIIISMCHCGLPSPQQQQPGLARVKQPLPAAENVKSWINSCSLMSKSNSSLVIGSGRIWQPKQKGKKKTTKKAAAEELNLPVFVHVMRTSSIYYLLFFPLLESVKSGCWIEGTRRWRSIKWLDGGPGQWAAPCFTPTSADVLGSEGLKASGLGSVAQSKRLARRRRAETGSSGSVWQRLRGDVARPWWRRAASAAAGSAATGQVSWTEPEPAARVLCFYSETAPRGRVGGRAVTCIHGIKRQLLPAFALLAKSKYHHLPQTLASAMGRGWIPCFWTPHVFAMDCTALKISLKSPGAVHFSENLGNLKPQEFRFLALS